MTIDMTQFHDVLFEECFECLDTIKAELLVLNVDNLDVGKLVTLTRMAHTMKGSCASFGFMAISDYAKVLEHTFAEMRDATRAITPLTIELLLASENFVRTLVITAQNKEILDETSAQQHCTELLEQLNAIN